MRVLFLLAAVLFALLTASAVFVDGSAFSATLCAATCICCLVSAVFWKGRTPWKH